MAAVVAVIAIKIADHARGSPKVRVAASPIRAVANPTKAAKARAKVNVADDGAAAGAAIAVRAAAAITVIAARVRKASKAAARFKKD
jgi:hypothetical protein